MAAMQIIDEKKLGDWLEYRFQYISKFVNFGEDEINAIHSSAPILAPLVPKIVDAVYAKLFSFDVTKQYFLLRNEGYTGGVDANLESLSTESEQIKFRKDHLSKYLVKLVTAKYEGGFLKYLDFVGKLHTNKAGNKQIAIDYIHINGKF
jgi:hypothetical protein